MDFELTNDGDLYLGQQSIDDEGYLLYYITDPMGKRLPIETRDVNEATVPIRDFREIRNDEEKLQLIQTRLKTENPDFMLYEYVGASLSDFIGEPNNPNTAELIEKRVLETLLRNKAFKEEELTLNTIPISHEEVLVDVILQSESLYIRYAFSLNFEMGINNVYILDKNGQIIEEVEKQNPDIYEGIPIEPTEPIITEDETEEDEEFE